MGNIIAVFKNRSHTMQFASNLKRMGVRCKTINTPRELSLSCGISTIFPYENLNQAKFVLSKYNFTSFNGFYVLQFDGIFKKYISL